MGQDELDRLVGHYVDALGMATDYREAFAALNRAVETSDVSALAGRVADARFAAQVLGEQSNG